MARTRIPNALAMTAIKYEGGSDAEKDELARELAESGRHAEAVLLFQGRPEHAFLKAQAEWATAQGASFHLLLIRGMGADISDDVVRQCAETAERNGRFLDARRCFEALGDEEAIRNIAEHLPERLRPAAPVADG